MTFNLPENLTLEEDFYVFSGEFIHECFHRYLEIDEEKYRERVQYTEVNSWICTDTRVGTYAHYFDGELFAISYKSARKSDIIFFWVSKEHMTRFRDFLSSIELDVDGYLNRCNLIDQLSEQDIEILLTTRERRPLTVRKSDCKVWC